MLPLSIIRLYISRNARSPTAITINGFVPILNEFKTGIIRELSYMTVHSFYHLMGEDHMEEEDKKVMRQKEENVLKELGELCK